MGFELDEGLIEQLDALPLAMQNAFFAKYNHDKAVKSYYYLLLFFFGPLGAHKFYLEKRGLGIAYALTLGFFGFGCLYDLVAGWKEVQAYNTMKAQLALDYVRLLFKRYDEGKIGVKENAEIPEVGL
jgi:TM2 domain-containing membrane protein YozV